MRDLGKPIASAARFRVCLSARVGVRRGVSNWAATPSNRIAYLISPFSDEDCHNYEVEDAKYSGPKDELYKELE